MKDKRLPGKIYDGFKVVRSFVHFNEYNKLTGNPQIVSCFAFSGRVSYFINLWSTPLKGLGPLAVFTSFGDALGFKSKQFSHLNTGEFVIYACKYRKSKFKQLWYNMAGLHRTYLPENELPQGTDFADAVMITEEVK